MTESLTERKARLQGEIKDIDKQLKAAEKKRQYVFNEISDLVGSFMYYDRKECETLPRGEIEKLVEQGIISYDEMAEHFGKCLKGEKD